MDLSIETTYWTSQNFYCKQHRLVSSIHVGVKWPEFFVLVLECDCSLQCDVETLGPSCVSPQKGSLCSGLAVCFSESSPSCLNVLEDEGEW